MGVAFIVGKAQKGGFLWEEAILFVVEPSKKSKGILVALNFLDDAAVVNLFGHGFGGAHPDEAVEGVVVEFSDRWTRLPSGPAKPVSEAVEDEQQLFVSEVLLVAEVEEDEDHCVKGWVL